MNYNYDFFFFFGWVIKLLLKKIEHHVTMVNTLNNETNTRRSRAIGNRI